MKRKGIKANIPSNHTICKHFNIEYTDSMKQGKYKSKFRKQHDYWPFKDKKDWDENMRYNGRNFLRTINFSDDSSIEVNYSRKPFYSICNSDKYDGFCCYLDFTENRRMYKSKKAMKKQKGKNKNEFIIHLIH